MFRWVIAGASLWMLTASVQAQFTSFRSDPAVLIEGNWQSCRDEDGYSERIVDLYDPRRRLAVAEFHMGPYHDFALFKGVQRTEDHRDHASPDNLLHPYVVGQAGEQMMGHAWTEAGFHIVVTLAGGSREDCESWFVTVTRVSPTR